eukprot:7147574-Pyramimonas_sp.AAC.1
MDKNVNPHGPELVAPASLGELRLEILATPVAAGPPANMPASPAAPPSRYATGETTFERQSRTRPSATPLIISDDDFTTCAVYLEKFACHDK